MILASTSVDTVLLVLKIAFLVLLYLFIWRIVRTAGKDSRSSQAQESFILRPGGSAALDSGRLVVLQSTNVKQGEEFELDSAALTIGRGGQNDVALEGDDYASAKHVRIEPRRDGVWVHDLGSTNGTFVNGVQIDKPQKLSQGDVVRVGETELRYDA
jgi:pSer/pThr/pTyr-binding forkhead associated (FHA) protein